MTKSTMHPKLHFTPQKNWINDPNGLVFYKCEWHLFYQYNPYGIEWGNMNWGHAVSKDLVHWTELGIAIKEDDENMIFSGSCVIDWNNTSGFGDSLNPPMIAIYTDHKKSGELQTQSIAYSLDSGRTFTKYDGNPVLDINQKDFRDPKVFWHSDTMKWVMVVCNSANNTISLYNSLDLKIWEWKSNFGPAGFEGQLWECPDLFALKISGTDILKWVLKVDIFEAFKEKYSLGQAFIGSFDGEKFIADTDEVGAELCQRIDFGHDFYAAMSWSDVPQNDGRRIWTAWMNSHHYANKTPAASWRGSMALPREITLVDIGDKLHLRQNPAKEIGKLVKKKIELNDLHDIKTNAYEIIGEVEGRAGIGSEIRIKFSETAFISFGYDFATSQLYIDRSKCGETGKIKEFGEVQKSLRISKEKMVKIHAILDYNSIEIFFDGGIQVFTEIFFPSSGSFKIEFDNRETVSIELFRFEE